MKDLVLIALGGNAVLQPGQVGTFEEQVSTLRRAARGMAALLGDGYRLALTHGNGPQVGNILIQNEAARDQVPAMPLSACGAQSQGLIGFMFQLVLSDEIARCGLTVPVSTIVTRVAVDPSDPAFSRPTKPVGPFFSQQVARALEREQGYTMIEDAGRGWRRVVPSPEPREILEMGAIRTLVNSGAVVIAAGGGGIPVSMEGEPVDAVIDKDLTGALLASELGAHYLVILTDVPAVAINFGTPEQEYLGHITASEAARYLAEGHFPAGSMRPKVDAAIRFARSGGTTIISSLDNLVDAVKGRTGTRITGH